MRRGVVLAIASNVIFFLSGYALHFFLGRELDAVEYGIIGSVITVLDFEYLFLSNGVRQSLAREISIHNFSTKDLLKKSILFQLIIIAFFFSLNFFGAPIFASVLNDAGFNQYFKVLGFLVIANGFYVIILGLTDGLQKFGSSALLSTIYPIAKLGSIPLIMFVFHDPVIGLEVGYFLSLVLTTLVGLILLVPYKGRLLSEVGHKVSFTFVAKNTLSFSFFFIMVSLVLGIDTLIVRAVASPASAAGYYTGAVNFGKISYYLLAAVSTVLLPVVAKLQGRGDRQEAVTSVQKIVHLSVTLILPIAVVISASADHLLSSFYKPEYTEASFALMALAISNFCMGSVVVINMVLTSYGNHGFSNVLSAVALGATIPAFIISAKYGGISAIAVVSMLCCMVALCATVIEYQRNVGKLFNKKTIAGLVLNLILWILVRWLDLEVTTNISFILLLVSYIGIYALFVAILLALRLIQIPSIRNVLNVSGK